MAMGERQPVKRHRKVEVKAEAEAEEILAREPAFS